MSNPAMVLPDAMTGIQSIYKAIYSSDVPASTLELVHLRISQLNGCSACAHAGTASAIRAGESDERLHALPAWYESPLFDDAERAALSLAEAATRLADRPGAVSDDLWAEVSR